MIMNQQEGEQVELINPLGDPICEIKLAISKYAYLTHKISIQPYHEAIIQIKSNQSNSTLSFVNSYEPLLERCGITVLKGVMEIKNGQANLVVAYLISQVVHIPSGTIMATLQSFDEN